MSYKKANLSALRFYQKHRFEYSKVQLQLQYLDFLAQQPLSKDVLKEFEELLNDLSLRFSHLTFNNLYID